MEICFSFESKSISIRDYLLVYKILIYLINILSVLPLHDSSFSSPVSVLLLLPTSFPWTEIWVIRSMALPSLPWLASRFKVPVHVCLVSSRVTELHVFRPDHYFPSQRSKSFIAPRSHSSHLLELCSYWILPDLWVLNSDTHSTSPARVPSRHQIGWSKT